MLAADHAEEAPAAKGQRQYEFAVEVIAGPPNSVFRHTKVVTVKSKFVVENQTGMPIEIKQFGTPDLEDSEYSEETRCARRLEISERSVQARIMQTTALTSVKRRSPGSVF